MTSKRKADIQRKLTLTVVPRPPADLLDRIKDDIPKYLNIEAERDRFSRSIGFNLRIAASILLLVSIAAAMFMLVPERSEKASIAASAVREKNVGESRAVATAPAAPAGQVNVEIVQQQTAPAALAAPASPDVARRAEAAPARPRPAMQVADAREEQVVAGGVEGGVVGGVAGGVAEPPGEIARDVAPPPPAAPVVAMAETTQELGASRAESKTAVAAAPALVPQAFADELKLAPKSVFGISVDPAVFRRIRATIESGDRPSPSAGDVEALVNYFAGTPARRVSRGVRLEAEASPAPIGSNGHRGILRVTIDTAAMAIPPGGSVPPIATDARLEIDFNRDAVERFSPIGDDTTLLSEPALLHNLSVTGLYALDLRTPLKAKQRIATVRLTYRSVADGRAHTIVREVRGSDFAQPWTHASRRHRLASLGAIWGESLRGAQGGTDVARRAEELASQAPNDSRARELAEVAVASSGGMK